MVNKQKILVIGGLSRFGSGKYMKDVCIALNESGYKILKFSTNKMRFIKLIYLFRMLNNKSDYFIYFQPSICGISFIRDLFILLILKFYKTPKVYVILSHIYYKNYLFKLNFIRKFFFKNELIICAAKIKELEILAKKYIVITPICKTPFSEKKNNSKVTNNLIFSHIGYFDSIKGFDKFLDLVKLDNQKNFIAIGEPLNEKYDYQNNPNLTILSSHNNNDFISKINLLIDKHEQYPIYLFMSKYDLAPLLVLELGASKIPICVKKNSKSHRILSNFLPLDTYFTYTSLDDIINEYNEHQLMNQINLMHTFSKRKNQSNFVNKFRSFHLIHSQQ